MAGNTPSPMAAITTVVNPIYKPGSKDPATLSQILAWSNNDNAELVLHQRRSDDTGETRTAPAYVQMAANPPGNIANPSSLAAINFYGLINVYGWSKAGFLHRFSPTVVKIQPTNPIKSEGSTVGALAATSSPSTNFGYLYYLKKESTEISSIVEWKLRPDEEGVNDNFGSASAWNGSYLAASCYVSDGSPVRYVVYQPKPPQPNSKKWPLSYIVAEGANNTVPNTESAQQQTPLATCAIDINKDKTTATLFFYFVDGQGYLCRVTNDTKTGKWSEVTTYTKDSKFPTVESYSQLAVTPLLEERANLLTWVVASNDQGPATFRQYKDYWFAGEKPGPSKPDVEA